jgi:hypothetical protein
MSNKKTTIGFYVVCSALLYYCYNRDYATDEFNAYTDPISERQKWRINEDGGNYPNEWTRSDASKEIKRLAGAKSKSNRNPLSIINSKFAEDCVVLFNNSNDEVIGAVVQGDIRMNPLMVTGEARNSFFTKSLKKNVGVINSTFANWFAWKTEPQIKFVEGKFIVGVEGIINYEVRSWDIESSGYSFPLQKIVKPSKQTDIIGNKIGDIKKISDYLKIGGYRYDVKTFKKVVAKIPAKDTFTTYFEDGLLVIEGSDWDIYFRGEFRQ